MSVKRGSRPTSPPAGFPYSLSMWAARVPARSRMLSTEIIARQRRCRRGRTQTGRCKAGLRRESFRACRRNGFATPTEGEQRWPINRMNSATSAWSTAARVVAGCCCLGSPLAFGTTSAARKTGDAADVLESMCAPLLIHQPSYSMLNRWVERGLFDVLGKRGIGCIALSPLAQGLLTDKCLVGVPEGFRAASTSTAGPR